METIPIVHYVLVIIINSLSWVIIKNKVFMMILKITQKNKYGI